MGFPARETSGLPGRRVELYLAGMTITTFEALISRDSPSAGNLKKIHLPHEASSREKSSNGDAITMHFVWSLKGDGLISSTLDLSKVQIAKSAFPALP
jgi:hypothetical protein